MSPRGGSVGASGRETGRGQEKGRGKEAGGDGGGNGGALGGRNVDYEVHLNNPQVRPIARQEKSCPREA